MNISLVVAQAQNGVIGYQNKLPWHLPADLKHFKNVTMGKPIIMGRKTFESIGKPLPGRTNVIITRDHHYHAEGILVCHSLDEVFAKLNLEPELMVIGGAEIFKQALPLVNRIYLTQIEASFTGDAFMPDLDTANWQEISREDHLADQQNPYPYSFITLIRKN